MRKQTYLTNTYIITSQRNNLDVIIFVIVTSSNNLNCDNILIRKKIVIIKILIFIQNAVLGQVHGSKYEYLTNV